MIRALLFAPSVLLFLVFMLVRSAHPGFSYISLFTSIIFLFVALSFLTSPTRVRPSQTRVRASPPPESVRPGLSIPLTAQKAHATLTDLQFELFAAAVIIGGEQRGYTFLRHCGKSGDRGVDVLLKDHLGQIVCVQAKKYKVGNTVKAHQVREFSAAIGGYWSRCGYLVTTSTLTHEGKKHIADENFRSTRGHGKEMHMIDQQRLDEPLRTYTAEIDKAWKNILENHVENG